MSELDSTTSPRPAQRQPRDRLTLVVGGLLAVPLLVGAVVVLSRSWYPAMDWALIELRIRDVGSSKNPLLGPFSRYGWNHPGPLMFWLFAPVYRLLGVGSTATLAAGALWNAGMVVAVAALARRAGGRSLLLLLGGAVALLCASLGGEVLVDPWNPWVSLLPFTLFMLATWATTRGDLLMLPVLVATGSFLVQTHVGYGALVAALGTWALAFVVATAWRARGDRTEWPRHRRRLVRLGAASVGLGLLLWSGPIADQLTNDPGNVRQTTSYFVNNDDPSIGLREAGTVVGRSMAPLAPWFGGPEPQSIFTAELERTNPLLALPVLSVFAVASAVAARRRDRDALLLAGTVAVGLVAGSLALTRISGEAFFYIVRWWWILAMFTWVSAAWSLARAVPLEALGRWRATASAVALPTGLLVIVVAGAVTTASVLEPIETDTNNDAVEELTEPVAEVLDPDGAYVVRSAGFSWFETLFGLVNQLDARGFELLADQQFRPHLGPGRTPENLHERSVSGTLVVATGDAVAELAEDEGLELIGEHDPLSADERSELEELQDQAREQLREAGRDDLLPRVADGGLQYVLVDKPDLDLDLDPGAPERITELLWRGTRAAVFLGPAPAG